jgi:hypothetical protein
MQPTGAGCVQNNSQPTVPTVQNSSVPCRCPWVYAITGATASAGTGPTRAQHYWETNYTCNGSPVYQQGNRAGGMVLYQRTESRWRGSWAIGPSERRKDCATWEGVTVYADPDACDVDGCSMRPPQDVPPGAWMERTGSPGSSSGSWVNDTVFPPPPVPSTVVAAGLDVQVNPAPDLGCNCSASPAYVIFGTRCANLCLFV